MTNFRSIFAAVRRLRVAMLGSLVIGYSSLVVAAMPAASVASVQPTRIADLVMLDHGFDGGLRPGMVCRVTRGATDIAEILLVDLRRTCSAALIVNLNPGQTIRAGDLARIKLLKS